MRLSILLCIMTLQGWKSLMPYVCLRLREHGAVRCSVIDSLKHGAVFNFRYGIRMEEKDEKLTEETEKKDLPKTEEEIQKSKRDFGLGIYGSKKRISLRLLDGFIALLIIAIIAIMIFFSRDSGYTVRFVTDIEGLSIEGMEIEEQDVGYGHKVDRPEDPEIPGYTFEGWYLENGYRWDFATDTVGNDMVLYARYSIDKDE